MKHASHHATALPSLVALSLLYMAACGAQQRETAPPRTGPESGATPATAAPPPAPRVCEVGDTEHEVAEEILARSGRGLLWLVLPSDEDGGRAIDQSPRGAADVRSARALAECLLRHHDAGFDPTGSKGHRALETWVDEHLGPEHAETLLAAGAAYFASLLIAESGLDAMLDLPAARLFLERATAAAPELADGLGPLILGSYECYVPRPLGGQPEAGLQRLEEAANRGGPLSLAMKVASAELCAFNLQDRALFDRLLDEVAQSESRGAAVFDLLAKRRAEQVRREADEMFLE